MTEVEELTKIDVKTNEFFGDQVLRLDFPETWDVKEVKMAGHDAPALTDGQIRDSFVHPIGSETIGELARGKTGRIVITVDDLTRPTPVSRVLPFIMKELEDAGIADDQILIIGAIGLHHPMNLQDFSLKIGSGAVAKYEVVNHHPFEYFEEVGKTSYGTPLKINYEFAKADLKIVVCGVKRHNFAGASGSGKAVIPGVASIDTILYNHTVIPSPLDDSTSCNTWKIKGNVPREDMQEAARMAGVDVTVNCTCNGDRDLIGLHVGDLDDAWHEAVRFCYRMHSCRPPTKKADIVVVNAYPQATQGADWWGAVYSLRVGGSAVAISKHPWASAIVHYLEERRSWRSSRLHGNPDRPWPVKQAEQIIQYNDFLTMREKLQYSNKLEWVTSWPKVIEGLNRTQGDSAKVVVFHNKLQFNPDDKLII